LWSCGIALFCCRSKPSRQQVYKNFSVLATALFTASLDGVGAVVANAELFWKADAIVALGIEGSWKA